MIRCHFLTFIVILMTGCDDKHGGTMGQAPSTSTVAKLDGKRLRDHGFKEQDGVYYNPRIRFGELCKLIRCEPDEFNVPFSQPGGQRPLDEVEDESNADFGVDFVLGKEHFNCLIAFRDRGQPKIVQEEIAPIVPFFKLEDRTKDDVKARIRFIKPKESAKQTD